MLSTSTPCRLLVGRLACQHREAVRRLHGGWRRSRRAAPRPRQRRNVGTVRQTRAVTAQPADTAALRKARGAFFTPPAIARYVADWALRSGADRVLEPSCGEAAFLLAAAARLDALAERGSARVDMNGVELHEESARMASEILQAAGVQASITVADFFDVDPAPLYDVVIGNPPYVRYQDFSGDARIRSRAAALRAGVALTNLASSWAAFTVHAALFLKPGGRLGLVLPAELLTVNYAASVRQFLMDRFSRVDLVLFAERVFPGVQEEVLLLLAEGFDQGPTSQCRIVQARNAEDLGNDVAVAKPWRPNPPEGKWTPSLLSSEAVDVYATLAAGGDFTTLDEWGDTTLGMVTGNNRYFALTNERVAELGLRASDLLPLSPPGSRHLRGLTFTDSAWAELGRGGSPIWLFRPIGEPSETARHYIAAGESTGVHEAYKCRVRNPWWRVPLVRPASLLLTYMNADTPRLCTNRAQAHHLNSVHGVYVAPKRRRLAMDYLPLASINSMTLVGAETVGRAYGGGMLKVEPREADRLPMPSPQLIESTKGRLAEIRPQVGRLLGARQLTEAARLIDEILLVGGLGVKRSDVKALRDAHSDLTARRVARGGRGPDADRR